MNVLGPGSPRLFPNGVPRVGDLDQTENIPHTSDGAGNISNGGEFTGAGVSKLANIFNLVHFQDETIIVNFKHSEYGTVISVEARPLPCLDGTLTCQWVDKDQANDLAAFQFEELLVSDGLKLLSVKPALKQMSPEGISFSLQGDSHEISARTIRRHPSVGIQAEVVQTGTLFRGVLRDFSSLALSVEIKPEPPQTFHWIAGREPLYAILRKDSEVVYSGDCEISRQCVDHKCGSGTFVLKPRSNQASRFKSKGCRSQRCELVPSPVIYFEHPLSGTTVTLEVDDLSGSGLSVQEYYDNSVLLPGLNIKELCLEIAPNFTIKCKGQVVYSQVFSIDDRRPTMKCGISFLDMSLENQATLSALVQRANDKGSQVCNRVDLDTLWRFFFEVGFVYPSKYANMHAQKEEFKALYKKLYIDSPDLARHFIVQDRGEILAHLSMVQVYEKTWLMHHHAARRTRDRKAGLTVLNQVSQYVNNFHLYHSSGMQYIISYYRPDNRFPERVFGGFQKHMNNPDCCSVEQFAFFHMTNAGMSADIGSSLLRREGMEISAVSTADIVEFRRYCESRYSRPMLQALDLDQNSINSIELTKKYEAAGLLRERKVYAVKKSGDLQAIVAITATDGLNLSNLTNSMKIFVIQQQLDLNLLYAALSTIAVRYHGAEIPVLLSPVEYATRKAIPFEKIYQLWVLNVPRAGDNFLQYMKTLTDRTARKTDDVKWSGSLS